MHFSCGVSIILVSGEGICSIRGVARGEIEDLSRGGKGMASRIKTHKEVKEYISKLTDGKPIRKKEAREALIRTGVLDKNGKKKSVIVSWE